MTQINDQVHAVHPGASAAVRGAVLERRQLLRPVAERIRWARRSRSMACTTLAGRLGVRPESLRRVEHGQQGVSAAAVGRIARALGIDEEELYPGGRPDAFWALLLAHRGATRVTAQVAAGRQAPGFSLAA